MFLRIKSFLMFLILAVISIFSPNRALNFIVTVILDAFQEVKKEELLEAMKRK